MAAYIPPNPSPPRSPSLDWHSTTVGGGYVSGYHHDALDNTWSQSQSQQHTSFVSTSPSFPSSLCHAALDSAPAYSIQQAATSHVNPEELQRLSRSAHEAPWSDSALRRTRLRQHPPHWPPYRSTRKAHTVAGGAMSPLSQRPGPVHYQASLIDSAYESRSQDTTTLASLSTRLESGEVPEAALSRSASPSRRKQSEAHLRGDDPSSKRKRAKSSISPCSTCGLVSKNQSDAKKHRDHHTRPYICQEPACPRKEGFGTMNDLQRHKRCVHGALPDAGDRLGHRCRACPKPPFGEPPKWWPRLDNFKAHITRKHQGWNVNELVANSEVAKSMITVSDPGYVSNHPRSQAAGEEEIQFDPFHPLDTTMSSHELFQDAILYKGDYTDFASLAGVGEGTLGDDYQDDRDLLSAIPGPPYEGTAGAMDLLGGGSFQQTDSEQPMMDDFGVHDQIGHQPNVHDIPSSYDSGQWMDYAMPMIEGKYSTQAPSVDPSDALSACRDESGRYVCRDCGKEWKRECDLRKHLKRHQKPYGCTFPGCDREFGSRYDWRRHERSKHALKEMWRCELADNDGNTCGELYQDEELFIDHLHAEHELEPGDPVTTRYLQEMAFGGERHFRIWCGFCNAVVTPDEPRPAGGARGWESHSSHVGDHFDKDKRHVDEWICIEVALRETRRQESDLLTWTERNDDGVLVRGHSPRVKRTMDDVDLDAEGFTESE